MLKVVSDGEEQQISLGTALEDKNETRNEESPSALKNGRVIIERQESIHESSTSTLFASGSLDEYQKCTAVNSVTNTLVACNSLTGAKAALCVLSVSPELPQIPPVLRYRTPTNNGEEVNDVHISPDGQFVVYVTDSGLVILPSFPDGENGSDDRGRRQSIVSTVAPVILKEVPSSIVPAGSEFSKVRFIDSSSLIVAINHPKRAGATLAMFQFAYENEKENATTVSYNTEKPTKNATPSTLKLLKYRSIISKSSVTALDSFIVSNEEQHEEEDDEDEDTAIRPPRVDALTGYVAFATADLSVGAVSLPSLSKVLLDRNAHPFAITSVALSPASGTLLASASAANTVSVHPLMDPIQYALKSQQASKRKMTVLYTLLSAVVLAITAVLLQVIVQYKILGDLVPKAQQTTSFDGLKTSYTPNNSETEEEHISTPAPEENIGTLASVKAKTTEEVISKWTEAPKEDEKTAEELDNDSENKTASFEVIYEVEEEHIEAKVTKPKSDINDQPNIADPVVNQAEEPIVQIVDGQIEDEPQEDVHQSQSPNDEL